MNGTRAPEQWFVAVTETEYVCKPVIGWIHYQLRMLSLGEAGGRDVSERRQGPLLLGHLQTRNQLAHPPGEVTLPVDLPPCRLDHLFQFVID
jgi:hypothetical protein